MQDINVLVVFHSRTGRTEKLALAAAVGAVQAKANIRLRWLREAVDDGIIQSVLEWKENRARMEDEYIAPRAIDAGWADAIIIASSGSPAVLRDYLAALDALRSEGKLNSKVETAFIDVPDGAPPEAVEKARLQGRRVTDAARAVKNAGVGPSLSTSEP
jgi:NAD(P)H dehydrogenase (quinone)